MHFGFGCQRRLPGEFVAVKNSLPDLRSFENFVSLKIPNKKPRLN